MTTDEIRIVVAELCGYVWHRRRNGMLASDGYWGEVRISHPPEEGIAFEGAKGTVSETRLCTYDEIEQAKATGKFNGLSIINYTSSLDACAEFEKKISLSERDLYLQALGTITQKSRMATIGWTNTTAKPLQRCEAFLRLKGKWKD